MPADIAFNNKPNTTVERTYVSSFIEFEDVFQIFLGFKDPEVQYDIKSERRHFKELLCHPRHELCINIVTKPTTNNCKNAKYIVLRPDHFHLELSYQTLWCPVDDSNEVFNKELLKKLFKSMDTEWDRKILRVILSLSRTRKQIDELGMNSDSIIKEQAAVFEYFERQKDVEKEAEELVVKRLQNQQNALMEKLKKVKQQMNLKQDIYTPSQLQDLKDDREDYETRLENVESLLANDTNSARKFKGILTRTCNNLIKQRRLKLRSKGSGRKRLMDENDEKFLEHCIAAKATAHGRRQDSVLYLNNRVKKRDMVRIVNHNRIQRNLKPIRSETAVFNRSMPKNKRSKQAKNHIGMGLFCCKKPPKTEDCANLLTHFCRAHKRMLSENLVALKKYPC